MKTPSEAGRAPREAISYLRFSSKEQELGDSERRQIAHSERWCSEHGYTLSKETYADRGRSALHGKHRTTGSLGRLLKAAKPGSLILIENLDRWSREDDLDSQLELRKAVNSGVELMFLSENLLVTKANFNDLNVRCVVFFGAVRAHGESVRKSELQAANWEKKHAAAKAGKPVRLNRPPCWLQWNQDAGKYEEDKAKAAVVRKLFELAGEGRGLLEIVRTLNGTPPLTTGPKAAWNLSTLRRVLLSKEALGFYCPTDGGQPVSGFFPAVVTEAQYYAAQGRLAIAKQVKRTLKRGDGNLFTSLAFCACGATLLLHGGRLVCGGTRKGGTCGFRGAPVGALETALFETLADGRLANLLLASEHKPTRLDALAGELADAEKQTGKLAKIILGDSEPSPVIYAGLKAAEARAKAVRSEMEQEKAKALTPAVGAYKDFRANLRKRLNDPAARPELRRAVNAIVERLTLDPRGMGVRGPRAWRAVSAQAAPELFRDAGQALPKAWQAKVRLRGSGQAFTLEFIVGGWRLAGRS